MEKSIEDVAQALADAHRKEDPETRDIFLAPHSSEVRLVEVSGSLAPSGEVLPFRFAPSVEHGVPYASVVVLLGVEDWERIKSGDLQLPPDWGTPGTLKKIA